MDFETLTYETDGRVATITLNRPERLNTIVPPMPDEIEQAVVAANSDPEVRVIILRGAGRGFCGGFDFADGLSAWGPVLNTDGRWDPGKDMIAVTSSFSGPVPKFMSMWRSPKPVIAQIHGWCVGGGSDMALCADLVIASEDAQIGTPYSRVWGCYLSGMWLYRLGLTRAKEFALTGKPLSGKEAAEVGLINKAVPFERLEQEVRAQAEALAQIPVSQLAAMKLIVNQAYENMGLHSTQTLGPILDGFMRNTPEALSFVETAESAGVGAAVEQRDGPFGDYSQAPRERQPRRENVIDPGAARKQADGESVAGGHAAAERGDEKQGDKKRAEKAEKRAEKEKRRAEKAERRAGNDEKRAEKAENRAEKEKGRAEKGERRAVKDEKRAEKAERRAEKEKGRTEKAKKRTGKDEKRTGKDEKHGDKHRAEERLSAGKHADKKRADKTSGKSAGKRDAGK